MSKSFRVLLSAGLLAGLSWPALAADEPVSVDVTASADAPAATEQAEPGWNWEALTTDRSSQPLLPGVAASSWIAMQVDGTQASANAQAASAVQREKAAERFLKTYDYAIKESFYGSSFSTGGK